MKRTKIKIGALIEKDIALVWQLWTTPKHITKWNFASDDWHCPEATNDLKVGGKYNARMEAKDGSFGFDFVAIYDEVIDHKKLSYNMEDGRNATTEFQRIGSQTQVTTVFDAENENPIEMQKDGWQAILNNFKFYAERQ